MKIFNSEDNVNFVDKNDVFLGYDMTRNCCEEFGWYITNQKDVVNEQGSIKINKDIVKYCFDTNFILVKDSRVFFRITDGTNEKFICLFNYHNGYYYHGFTFKMDNIVLQQKKI